MWAILIAGLLAGGHCQAHTSGFRGENGRRSKLQGKLEICGEGENSPLPVIELSINCLSFFGRSSLGDFSAQTRL